jgi:hypothetical protein
VRRHVPADLQRLHIPALAASLGLMVVANAYEPRAFGEVVVLAWIAVAAGVGRWLQETVEPAPARPTWLLLVDRLAAPGLLALAAVLTLGLHRWAFLPLMP